ncbi:MAG: protein kinase [Planctomycetes bacterium]|nr:protein kinase [Planctomycetota bacterium]
MTEVVPPQGGDGPETRERVDLARTQERAGAERPPEPPLPPSTLIDRRYLLVHELGRGGMGIVYRAVDQTLGRQVALKTLQRHVAADPDLLARFLEEARVTARLQHPAIMPVFEVGRDDGRPDGPLVYYTMRLVEGRTLAELAEEGWTRDRHRPDRLTLFRALEVFVQACRAVGYAHERGLVHRDLKPGNVMVGRFGEVHVLDWGLAKTSGWTPPPDELPHVPAAPPEGGTGAPLSTRDLTRSGTILGTPAYMAPEQATGEPLDARADVYALGGILYTLLTGKLPHDGTTSQVLWRITWGIPPTLPSAAGEDVPTALDAICMRAMAPDREARYPTAAALAEAVEDFLEGRPATSSAPDDPLLLRAYRPSEHRRPSLTVDIVVLHAPPGATPRVLLHRRARPPYQGCWAIPGSFVRLEDDLETAARRTLWAETGIGSPDLVLSQVGTFGNPARDPRTRVVTVAYLVVVAEPQPPPIRNAEEEADRAGWFEVEVLGPHEVRLRGEDEAPEPAFDHEEILAAALRCWRRRAP